MEADLLQALKILTELVVDSGGKELKRVMQYLIEGLPLTSSPGCQGPLS